MDVAFPAVAGENLGKGRRMCGDEQTEESQRWWSRLKADGEGRCGGDHDEAGGNVRE